MAIGSKDMSLTLRILARGNQALGVLNAVRKSIGALPGAMGKAGSFMHGGWTKLASVTSLLFRPLKMLATMTTAGAVALGGLSAASLASAGNVETLRMRLEGVTSSAEEAARIFKETMDLSIASPFEPQELIDARIALINIGLSGSNAITAIGDAASITQRPLADLAMVLASMETEPLRRIGINLKREGGKFEFDFRDRMQKVRSIVANGVDEARQKLLEIFDIKYGGGMSKFAQAWQGLTSTLSGNIKLAMAKFGEGMLPAAKRFVGGLNDQIAGLMASGRLEAMGEGLAGALTKAWDYGAAVLQTAQKVMENLQQADYGDALRVTVLAAGELMAKGLLRYLQGMGGVFTAFGRMMSSAFKADFLKFISLFPTGKAHLANAAKNKMEGMSQRDLLNMPRELGYKDLTAVMAAYGNDATRSDVSSKILAWDNTGSFLSAIDDARNAIPEAARAAADDAREIWSRLTTELGAMTNIDIGGDIQSRVAQIEKARQQREAQAAEEERLKGLAVYRASRGSELVDTILKRGEYKLGQVLPSGFRVDEVHDNPDAVAAQEALGGTQHSRIEKRGVLRGGKHVDAKASPGGSGVFRGGAPVKGGSPGVYHGGINIDNLTIRTNHPKDWLRKLKEMATAPLPAAAGT